MIPNDSMSSRTVTRMKRTAARRGGVPVDVSVMTGASYQAVTPNCRMNFVRRRAEKFVTLLHMKDRLRLSFGSGWCIAVSACLFLGVVVSGCVTPIFPEEVRQKVDTSLS